MQKPGNHTFLASNLHILAFGGELRIEPWSEDDRRPAQGQGGPYRSAPTSERPQGIVVTLTGSEERLGAVTLTKNGDVLEVNDSKAKSGDGGGASISVNGGTVHIRGVSAHGDINVTSSRSRIGTMHVSGPGSIGINVSGDGVMINGVKIDPAAYSGEKDAEPLSAVIRVPVGAAVEIDELYQDARIGDTLGPLTVSMMGGADLTVGRVTSTSLSLKGGGDVRIQEVQESLAVQLMGSSDVTIAGGTVESIAINVMGSGDVRFGGTAKNGSVSVMGSGDVRVSRVTGRVTKNCMGSGVIRLG